jgi:hypothetical protein
MLWICLDDSRNLATKNCLNAKQKNTLNKVEGLWHKSYYHSRLKKIPDKQEIITTKDQGIIKKGVHIPEILVLTKILDFTFIKN